MTNSSDSEMKSAANSSPFLFIHDHSFWSVWNVFSQSNSNQCSLPIGFVVALLADFSLIKSALEQNSLSAFLHAIFYLSVFYHLARFQIILILCCGVCSCSYAILPLTRAILLLVFEHLVDPFIAP